MKKIYLLFIGIALLGACEKDANFIVNDGNSKLYAFSEISTDNKIIVSVNTSIGANSEDDFIFPKQSEAKLTLYREGVALEVPGFRYLENQKAFVSQGAFRPEAGIEYSLEVKLQDDTQIRPILATTLIPIPEELENVTLTNFKEKMTGDKKLFSVTAEVNLSELENDYFILKPLYYNGEEEEYLKVNFVMQGNSGARYSKYHNGLLINSAKANKIIQINMGNSSSIDTDFSIKEISFEVLAITQDAYIYYSAFNKQMDAESAALAEPVISYSNFENGLGLFTGYSTSKTSFPIN